MDQNTYVCRLLDIELHKDSDEPFEKCRGVFLVLELWPTDLWKVTNDGSVSRLKEEHIKIFMFNILSAIRFTHEAGVIHRDIKSANVLIDSNCKVSICDFGISRTIPTSADKKKRLLSSHVQTRWYRAPEVILKQEYGKEIDVWSLGCIFGEMLLSFIRPRYQLNLLEHPLGLFKGTSCYPLSPD
jgi:mitogen-activated protein kinase 1/3